MSREIERKYIIKKPEIENLVGKESYSVSEIEQIYLESDSGTHRIRKRSYADRTVFTETRKIRIDKISSVEDEREITENEYNELKKKQKKNTVVLKKTRHVFFENGQIFEVDIYPEWKRTAIMETELKNRTTQAEIPACIEIIKEVTGIKEYTNAEMSKSFPSESEFM